MDHLGLVKAIDRLSQSIVIAVAHAANRRLDPGSGKALGVSDRYILAAAVAVRDQAAPMNRAPLVDSLLQCIQR
jgi:hypothetical protein